MNCRRANNYICKRCKSPVQEYDNYCKECGKKLCQIRFAHIEENVWGR